MTVYGAQLVAKLAEETRRARASVPDDIRALGWTVAVHSDYRHGAALYTRWIFIQHEKAVRGEGETDRDALNVVRVQLGLLAQ